MTSNRDKGHAIVARTLHRIGAIQRPSITARFQADPGSADVLCSIHGLSACIEIKTGNEAIPFPEWRDNQREWAVTHCRAHQTEYWLWWLVRNPARGASTAYLLPYPEQIALEALIRPIQDSLPQRAGKGYHRSLQARGLDCARLLPAFETPLYWLNRQRYFAIPDPHPFHAHYSRPDSSGRLWAHGWIKETPR